MVKERFEELMYHSGLTADGCWNDMDQYDQEAVLKFAELIVRECMDVVSKKCASPTAYQALSEHFGVE